MTPGIFFAPPALHPLGRSISRVHAPLAMRRAARWPQQSVAWPLGGVRQSTGFLSAVGAILGCPGEAERDVGSAVDPM
jgi:hypothetical protein